MAKTENTPQEQLTAIRTELDAMKAKLEATEGKVSDQDEEYLTKHGWKRNGVNVHGVAIWADPTGEIEWGEKTIVVPRRNKQTNKIDKVPIKLRVDKRIHEVPVVQIQRKDKTIETIHQTVVPGCAWDYTSDEAVKLQQLRDGQQPDWKPAEAFAVNKETGHLTQVK
jgi:hypothetical protein